ncbi:MAG: hypothetical protein ACR2Q3_09265 [Woeseiaceae bacterium]
MPPIFCKPMSKYRHYVYTACLLIAAGTPTFGNDQVAGQELEKRQPGQSAEKKFTMTFETKQHKDYCKSSTSIEYQQRNNVAHVTGEINVDGCITATGAYTVSIRTRNDKGEMQNMDFEETWARNDEQPIAFAKDYPIGDNVDLVRARVRHSSCICNDIEIDDDSEN